MKKKNKQFKNALTLPLLVTFSWAVEKKPWFSHITSLVLVMDGRRLFNEVDFSIGLVSKQKYKYSLPWEKLKKNRIEKNF